MTRKDSLEPVSTSEQPRPVLPPILGRLLTGTFWLALRVPLQAVFCALDDAAGRGSDRPGPERGLQVCVGVRVLPVLVRVRSELGPPAANLGCVDARRPRRGGPLDRLWHDASTPPWPCFRWWPSWRWRYWALPHTALDGRVVRSDRQAPLAPDRDGALLWIFGAGLERAPGRAALRLHAAARTVQHDRAVRRCCWWGSSPGVDFFLVVVAQTVLQIGIGFIPGLWVMVRELGHRPHFRGARLDDYRLLLNFSFYIALIQISVVLADKVDTTILGFMLADPGPANTVYDIVSKPFLQLRQTGWMLAYMVMPAVASLAAADDDRGARPRQVRRHPAAPRPRSCRSACWRGFMPVRSCRCGWATAWATTRPKLPPLMRLFLLAAIPLVLSVFVQMAIGLNKIKVIALAALAGSVVNLPLSCYLTARLGRRRGDLGNGAHDHVLEPARARRLRLPGAARSTRART